MRDRKSLRTTNVLGPPCAGHLVTRRVSQGILVHFRSLMRIELAEGSPVDKSGEGCCVEGSQGGLGRSGLVVALSRGHPVLYPVCVLLHRLADLVGVLQGMHPPLCFPQRRDVLLQVIIQHLQDPPHPP